MKLFQARPSQGFDTLPLAPLTPGDLIDLAVRIYRREPLRLIKIVLLPGLISYAGVVTASIGFSNFSLTRGDERVFLTVTLITLGSAIFLGGKFLFYALIGGVSRSIYNRISAQSSEPESSNWSEGPLPRTGEAYRAVKNHLAGLVAAIALLTIAGLFAATVIYFVAALILVSYVALHMALLSSLPLAVQIISGGLFGLALLSGLIWCVLIFYTRLVGFGPILVVEERGVSGSIKRSIKLFGGRVRAVGSLLFFWKITVWSLRVLLVVPVVWYGYLEGFDINPFSPEGPIWYLIAVQTLSQLSEILVAPVALIGFSLLYLDARVRMEGFDVEVLAHRILGSPANVTLQHRENEGL